MSSRVLPSVALVLIGAAAALTYGARAAGSGPDAAPRLRAFAPAAVHPGDEFLIDADFAGHRPPKVWVGPYRVPRSRVRVEGASGTDGARRVWARVPSKVPSGSHLLKIATRAGKALAAKPIRVAACGGEAFECPDDIPDTGVDLMVTGAGGYGFPIRGAASPILVADASDPLTAFVSFCGDPGDSGCLMIRMTAQHAAEMHVGTVPAIELSLYDIRNTAQWRKDPGGDLRVVEARPTGVGLCIDAVLTRVGGLPEGLPETVTVRGYVAISR